MIRRATTGDAPQIAAIWNWMIRDTLATFTSVEKPVAEIEDLIARRHEAFFVAETQCALDGFVTFGPFRAGPGYAATAEHSVIVRPDAQGASLGRALMRAAEEAAKNADHHVMVAAISGENPAAIAFHEALGYVRVAQMPQVGRKEGRWLDLILMQKILSCAD